MSIARVMAFAAAGVALGVCTACHARENLEPWVVHRPANVQQARFELRLVTEQPGEGNVTLPGSDGRPLNLAAPVLVQGDITRVEVQRDLLEVSEAQRKAEEKDDPPSVMKGMGKPPDPRRSKDDEVPHYVLLISFKPGAGARLHEATSQNLFGKMAMIVDGRVLMTPVITGVLGTGNPLMLARFTRQAAVSLAERLAP